MANGDLTKEVTSFRFEHLLKAFTEIYVTVLGIVMADKPVHPSNVEPPMDVRPSDRLTHVRPEQSSKAELPMLFTVLGILR
jgi:hypothetical protein